MALHSSSTSHPESTSSLVTVKWNSLSKNSHLHAHVHKPKSSANKLVHIGSCHFQSTNESSRWLESVKKENKKSWQNSSRTISLMLLVVVGESRFRYIVGHKKRIFFNTEKKFKLNLSKLKVLLSWMENFWASFHSSSIKERELSQPVI